MNKLYKIISIDPKLNKYFSQASFFLFKLFKTNEQMGLVKKLVSFVCRTYVLYIYT